MRVIARKRKEPCIIFLARKNKTCKRVCTQCMCMCVWNLWLSWNSNSRRFATFQFALSSVPFRDFAFIFHTKPGTSNHRTPTNCSVLHPLYIINSKLNKTQTYIKKKGLKIKEKKKLLTIRAIEPFLSYLERKTPLSPM